MNAVAKRIQLNNNLYSFIETFVYQFCENALVVHQFVDVVGGDLLVF